MYYSEKEFRSDFLKTFELQLDSNYNINFDKSEIKKSIIENRNKVKNKFKAFQKSRKHSLYLNSNSKEVGSKRINSISSDKGLVNTVNSKKSKNNDNNVKAVNKIVNSSFKERLNTSIDKLTKLKSNNIKTSYNYFNNGNNSNIKNKNSTVLSSNFNNTDLNFRSYKTASNNIKNDISNTKENKYKFNSSIYDYNKATKVRNYSTITNKRSLISNYPAFNDNRENTDRKELFKNKIKEKIASRQEMLKETNKEIMRLNNESEKEEKLDTTNTDSNYVVTNKNYDIIKNETEILSAYEKSKYGSNPNLNAYNNNSFRQNGKYPLIYNNVTGVSYTKYYTRKSTKNY